MFVPKTIRHRKPKSTFSFPTLPARLQEAQQTRQVNSTSPTPFPRQFNVVGNDWRAPTVLPGRDAKPSECTAGKCCNGAATSGLWEGYAFRQSCFSATHLGNQRASRPIARCHPGFFHRFRAGGINRHLHTVRYDPERFRPVELLPQSPPIRECPEEGLREL